MAKRTSTIDVSKLEIRGIISKVQNISNIPLAEIEGSTTATFAIDLNPLYNIEDNAIKIELRVGIDIEKGNEKYPKVAEFLFDFFYHYEGLADTLNNEKDIDAEIFVTCSNISYSTLRGIVYSKAANTCIENILLPVVSGAELVSGIRAEQSSEKNS